MLDVFLIIIVVASHNIFETSKTRAGKKQVKF